MKAGCQHIDLFAGPGGTAVGADAETLTFVRPFLPGSKARSFWTKILPSCAKQRKEEDLMAKKDNTRDYNGRILTGEATAEATQGLNSLTC